MRAVLCVILLVLMSSAALSKCRVGGVEWLVGGPGAAACPASDSKQSATSVSARGASTVSEAAPERTRISADLQSARDRDRMAILRQELDEELAQEARLQATPGAERASVERTRSNVQALRNEIKRLNTVVR